MFERLDLEIAKRGLSYFRGVLQIDEEPNKPPLFCAGGAVREWIQTRRVNRRTDFDLFTDSKTSADWWRERFERNGWTLVSETPKAETFLTVRGRPVQIITGHYFGTLEAVLSAFDFTICQFGFDLCSEEPNAIVGATSFQDLAMGRLIVNALPFPESSIARALKYAGKGFTICGGELGKLIDALKEQHVEHREEMAAAIQGALRIRALWLPGDGSTVEENEGAALAAMAHEFERVVAAAEPQGGGGGLYESQRGLD